MRILSKDEITKKFNESRETALGDTPKNIFKNLSRAISALQHASINVSLEMTGWIGNDVFKPPYSGGSSGGGLLNVGNAQFVLALINKSIDNKSMDNPCWKLNLSYYNKKMGDLDNRCWSFDLEKDPDALVKLQEKIIELAGKNEALQDCDIGNAFGTPSSPRIVKPRRLE